MSNFCKCKSYFANAKATHIISATHIFFSKNVSVYAIFNDKSFNNTLTNNSISFEQLGPDESLHYLTLTQQFLDASTGSHLRISDLR